MDIIFVHCQNLPLLNYICCNFCVNICIYIWKIWKNISGRLILNTVSLGHVNNLTGVIYTISRQHY